MASQIITRVPDNPTGSADDSWWSGYRKAAGGSGLSETALRALDLDTEYILRQGVLGAGPPVLDGGGWPAGRVRRGLVIGSVQSGKTASMLGLAAKAIDAHVDVIVVLSGTRVALWRQTLGRTLAQLDRWEAGTSVERELARILLPPPNLFGGGGPTDLQALYHVQPARMRRLLQKRRPVIAIVMKQADHLIRFGGSLRAALEVAFRRLERPLHMLVIDDEADDGSILDAVIEAGLGPESAALKQVPRHIARLWSARSSGSTFDERLFATYVAYTATPQANLLQSDHNPLSPRDFIVALRTPLDDGSLEPPRTVSYMEPAGLKNYYTGGEFFYTRFAEGADGLCHPIDFPRRQDFDEEDVFKRAVEEQRVDQLGRALRAFLVGAAMRLMHGGRRIAHARNLPPSSYTDVKAASPLPTSMLVHPSAAIEEQKRTARQIALWSANMDAVDTPLEDCPTDETGSPILDPAGLKARLEGEEWLWKEWFHSFELTRQRVGSAFPGHGFKRNDAEAWATIVELLVEDVFPHVRLALINSDPSADDRPLFQPCEVADGEYVAAPDLLSIFVSGNVMSRGVTLDGLTTTVFLRGSRSPAADTQMQMQRWFGYRGRHLYWCRVFLYRDQLDLFRAYHENDLALRGAVLAEMNDGTGSAPSPLVLQGQDFRATAKIANLRALPLCPGRQPFVRLLAKGSAAKANSELLADLLDEDEWRPLVVGSTTRGLIWDRALSLVEAAELLEALRYDDHDPDPSGRNHTRWSALAGTLTLQKPEAPLFRPPGLRGPTDDLVRPDGCPYSIAAYLRVWAAALTRKAPGLFPTDDHRTPWSMIDLSQYAASAPRFRVGVRFGGEEAGVADDERLREHRIRRMIRRHDPATGLLEATWGTRNPGSGADAYLGDHLFDYHATGLTPPNEITGQPTWRPRGHPGLLLFHVVRTDIGESVTVGLGLPLGGPDHFAAIAPSHRVSDS